MKICTNCKKEKEYSEFYVDSYQSDGFKTFCKQCDNMYSKAYYQKVKDNLSEKQKEKRRLAYKKWKRNNYEKYLALQKMYRDNRLKDNKVV